MNPLIDREILKNPNLLPFWVSVGVLIVILFSHFGLFPIPLFIAGVFGAFFLFVAWKWPRTLFGMFLASVPLEYIPFVSAGSVDVRWYQSFACILILGIFFRWIFGKERVRAFFRSLRWWDAVPVIIFLSGIFSAVRSGGGAMKQAIVLGSFVSLYFVIRYFIRKRKDIFEALPFFIGPFYVISLYAIVQNVLFIFGKTSGEVMPGRPNATFAEADWLGLYAGLGVVLASLLIASILLLKTELTKKQQALRVLSYEMLFFGSIVLILTVARSAWLATALGLLFVGCFLFWKRGFQKAFQWGKHIFFIGILAIIISFGFHLTRFELGNRASSVGGLQEITVACQGDANTAVPQTIDRVEDLAQYGCQHINLEDIDTFTAKGFVVQKIFRKDPNVEIRKQVWVTSWESVKQNPMWGIGWGNISQRLGTDERGAGLNASNIFLEFWLGSGVAGFAGILVFLGYIFIKNSIGAQGARCKVQEKIPDIDSRFIFSTGIIGLLTVLIIFNLFNSGQFLALFWVTLAFTLTCTDSKSARTNTSR